MPVRQAMNDVVVLVPGITGSVLCNGDGKVVWGYSAATIATALFSGAANIRRELALPHDDPDVDDLGDGITATALMPDLHLVPGLWKIDGYSAITDMLLANFELSEGRNFFRFPYDWRRHNRVAARRLARQAHGWLQAWRDSGHPGAKLILVAHSMGGLVSRWFLECMEGWKQTRALITFGTPYRGSLKALGALANGVGDNPSGLTPLIRELTSVYQLLPIFECWEDGDGALVRVDEVADIPNLDPARAADALGFHRDIRSAVAANGLLEARRLGGYQLYPIAGTAQRTWMSAKADGPTRVALSGVHRGKVLGGDGTVPRVSAIPAEMSGPGPQAMYAATSHGSLQNAAAVLAHLQAVLSGVSIDLGDFLKATVSGAGVPKVAVGLEVADCVPLGKPIVVKVRPAAAEVAFEVVVRGPAGEERRAARAGADGAFHAEFAGAVPGAYRVSVEGAAIESAEDSLVVAAGAP